MDIHKRTLSLAEGSAYTKHCKPMILSIAGISCMEQPAPLCFPVGFPRAYRAPGRMRQRDMDRAASRRGRRAQAIRILCLPAMNSDCFVRYRQERPHCSRSHARMPAPPQIAPGGTADAAGQDGIGKHGADRHPHRSHRSSRCASVRWPWHAPPIGQPPQLPPQPQERPFLRPRIRLYTMPPTSSSRAAQIRTVGR